MKQRAFVAAVSILLAACGGEGDKKKDEPKKEEAKSGKAEPSAPAKQGEAGGASTGAPAAAPGGGGLAGPATADGAKAVVADLQKDAKGTVAKLAPGADDMKKIFSDAAVAGDVKAHVDKLLEKAESFDKGEPEIHCASTDDVKAWKPEVEKHFPGGYKRVGDKLAAGLTLCKFKLGSVSYDALVNAGGKWFFVPKPFRAIKG